MDISLVIPAHDEAGVLGATLRTVFEKAPGFFREIVVIDNASSDTTAEVAQSFEGVRVVREERKGLPFARECGIANTTGEFVAFIDADTLITDGWAETVAEAFEGHPDVVAVSGPRRYFGAPAWKLRVLDLTWFIAPLVYRTVGYMILGGNFVARRSALSAMGGIDTSIGFYGEDTDIARRLAGVGKVVFRADLLVYASARRFETEGLLMPNIRYALNYLWPVLRGRPFSRQYRDIR